MIIKLMGFDLLKKLDNTTIFIFLCRTIYLSYITKSQNELEELVYPNQK